jgi:hypothetical protein
MLPHVCTLFLCNAGDVRVCRIPADAAQHLLATSFIVRTSSPGSWTRAVASMFAELLQVASSPAVVV